MITMNIVAKDKFVASLSDEASVSNETAALEKWLKSTAVAIATGDVVMNVRAAIVSVATVVNDFIEVTLSIIADAAECIYTISYTRNEWQAAIRSAMSV